MTRFVSAPAASFNLISAFDAKAQQEAFAQLNTAGRRVPVVFSHFLLTSIYNNNIKKGVARNHSLSAGGSSRHLSHNLNQGGKNSHFARGVHTPSFLNFESTISFSYNQLS